SRSFRVPTLIVVLTRGAPISCRTSWQRLTARNTSSHSPSTFVPYACSAVFSPASPKTRSQAATYVERETPTPRGTTETSIRTFTVFFVCPSVSVDGGHAGPADGVVLEVELDDDDRLFADDPAVVARLDRHNLRRLVFHDAAIGVLDVDLAASQESDVRVHAE